MSDLVEQIKLALGQLGDRPWLPELTAHLVQAGWEDLSRKKGLSPSNYGTARVIAYNADAQRNVIARISRPLDFEHLNEPIQIEILNESFAREYIETGIRFYTEDEIKGGHLLNCIEDAINILEHVPTLSPTVTSLVRSLHLIKAEDDDYDISFSEPHIPFSIFISVPQERSTINILRVAEAVVHEAMHLQLTLIEEIVPLVNSTNGKYFSPWREELRNAQGMLHGLYAFCVINRFLSVVQSFFLSDSYLMKYIDSRL
jgi:HEXXH motif-containing protein